MNEREHEILLTQRMFATEVNRLLARVESETDPVRRVRITQDVQREFNRLDAWFMRQTLSITEGKWTLALKP